MPCRTYFYDIKKKPTGFHVSRFGPVSIRKQDILYYYCIVVVDIVIIFISVSVSDSWVAGFLCHGYSLVVVIVIVIRLVHRRLITPNDKCEPNELLTVRLARLRSLLFTRRYLLFVWSLNRRYLGGNTNPRFTLTLPISLWSPSFFQ